MTLIIFFSGAQVLVWSIRVQVLDFCLGFAHCLFDEENDEEQTYNVDTSESKVHSNWLQKVEQPRCEQSEDNGDDPGN